MAAEPRCQLCAAPLPSVRHYADCPARFALRLSPAVPLAPDTVPADERVRAQFRSGK